MQLKFWKYPKAMKMVQKSLFQNKLSTNGSSLMQFVIQELSSIKIIHTYSTGMNKHYSDE